MTLPLLPTGLRNETEATTLLQTSVFSRLPTSIFSPFNLSYSTRAPQVLRMKNPENFSFLVLTSGPLWQRLCKFE